MLTKIAPNPKQASTLRAHAAKTLALLSHIPQTQFPEHVLLAYYDCIHALIEANANECGVEARGEQAHYELIEWVCSEKQLAPILRETLQSVRQMRNDIFYRGRVITGYSLEEHEPTIKHIIALLSQE